jgi:hypothetical protein
MHSCGIKTRAVALGLFLTFSASYLFAQAPGPPQGRGGGGFGRGGFGGFGGPGGPSADLTRLVTDPAVQEELKLSKKQKQQIDALDKKAQQRRDDFQQQMQQMRQALNNNANGAFPQPGGGFGQQLGGGGRGGRGNRQPPSPEMMQAMQVFGQQMAALRQEQEGLLRKILQQKQWVRLNQIALQQRGMRALADPDIALRLNLNEGQQERIQAILQQERQAQGELFASMRGAFGRGRQNNMTEEEKQAQQAQRDQRRAKQDQLRASTDKALGSVLTKKQGAAFKKMLGEPFDLSKLQAPPWMRGRGGPQGNQPASATAKNGSSTTKRAAITKSAQQEDEDEDAPPAPAKAQGRAPTRN